MFLKQMLWKEWFEYSKRFSIYTESKKCTELNSFLQCNNAIATHLLDSSSFLPQLRVSHKARIYFFMHCFYSKTYSNKNIFLVWFNLLKKALEGGNFFTTITKILLGKVNFSYSSLMLHSKTKYTAFFLNIFF
jgi:hypothetical protein